MNLIQFASFNEANTKKLVKVIHSIQNATDDESFPREAAGKAISGVKKVCELMTMHTSGAHHYFTGDIVETTFDSDSPLYGSVGFYPGTIRSMSHLLANDITAVIAAIKNINQALINHDGAKLEGNDADDLLVSHMKIIAELNEVINTLIQKEEEPHSPRTETEGHKIVITEEDLKNDPELEKEGVKAGDEIEIPEEALQAVQEQVTETGFTLPENPSVANYDKIKSENEQESKFDRKSNKPLPPKKK